MSSVITEDLDDKVQAQARVGSDEFDDSLPFSADVGLILKNSTRALCVSADLEGPQLRIRKDQLLKVGERPTLFEGHEVCDSYPNAKHRCIY